MDHSAFSRGNPSHWLPLSATFWEGQICLNYVKLWILAIFFKSSKVQSCVGSLLFLNIFSEVKNQISQDFLGWTVSCRDADLITSSMKCTHVVLLFLCFCFSSCEVSNAIFMQTTLSRYLKDYFKMDKTLIDMIYIYYYIVQ